MKQGDIITTSDGVELIAVPCVDKKEPCMGCFFYKEGECESVNIKCWNKIGDEFILTTLGEPICNCLNPFCPTCGKKVYE